MTTRKITSRDLAKSGLSGLLRDLRWDDIEPYIGSWDHDTREEIMDLIDRAKIKITWGS